MQRRVLLGAGAIVVAVAALIGLRTVTSQHAGHALDKNIDGFIAKLPPGFSVAHGATDFDPLTSTLTVHEVSLREPDGTLWTADRVTVAGANEDALRDVFNPAFYPNGQPAWSDQRLLIGDASITNLHAQDRGDAASSLTIASLKLHRLSGRPFVLPPTKANAATSRFQADAALALAADRITQSGVALLTPEPSRVKIGIGSVELSNYDAGSCGSFAIKGMRVDLDASQPGQKQHPPIHAELASASVHDLDYKTLLRSVRDDGQAHGTPALSANMGGADLSEFSFKVTGGPVLSLESAHAEQGTPNGTGREGSAKFTRLTMALGETPVPSASQAMVDAFGMRAITADVDASTRGQSPGDVTVNETLDLHDLGTLHVDLRVAGYIRPAAGNQPAALQSVMNTTLEQMKLVYDDHGLTDRLFKVAAVQSHTTPDMLRGQLAMPLLTLGIMVPDQPDIADQITAFLTHPHQLTITLNPPQKMTFAEIVRASALQRAHAAGLHVTGN